MNAAKKYVFKKLLETEVTYENGKKVYNFLKDETNIDETTIKMMGRSKYDYYIGIFQLGLSFLFCALSFISIDYAVAGESIEGSKAFLLFMTSAFICMISFVYLIVATQLLFLYPINHLHIYLKKEEDDEKQRELLKKQEEEQRFKLSEMELRRKYLKEVF